VELPDGRIPMGRNGVASINIQLARIGLVISVEWEHGTGRMDHILPTPTAYPMTQVGQNIMLAI
jgi:hypothetical protein